MNKIGCIIIGLLLQLHVLNAQQMTIAIDSLVAEIGTIVKVDFVIDAAVQNLRGYTLDMSYNSDLVELYSIIEGPVFLMNPPTFLWWTDNVNGPDSYLHIDHVVLGVNESVDGPGVILSLYFLGLDCGIETVAISDALFRDVDNMPLAISTVDLTHQFCQVPHLDIDIIFPTEEAMLSWNRIINSNFFRVYKSPDSYSGWTEIAVTPDTFYLDSTAPGEPWRFYYIVVDHY
ncbi:MAG: hypothetical protein ISR91_07950 [Candidatus Delongbacteria bacterium]|nr:hypothetical protein [Candidatus Delongbacteria bacterium]